MPFINTKTNIKISKEKEELIKNKLGKAIELINGKSEAWLMVGFEDEYKLYFKGANDSALAFVEVKIFGAASKAEYSELTKAITNILNEEIKISPDKIYIKYEEIQNWGWNGNNF